jgi:hypothetical protein
VPDLDVWEIGQETLPFISRDFTRIGFVDDLTATDRTGMKFLSITNLSVCGIFLIRRFGLVGSRIHFEFPTNSLSLRSLYLTMFTGLRRGS